MEMRETDRGIDGKKEKRDRLRMRVEGEKEKNRWGVRNRQGQEERDGERQQEGERDKQTEGKRELYLISFPSSEKPNLHREEGGTGIRPSRQCAMGGGGGGQRGSSMSLLMQSSL